MNLKKLLIVQLIIVAIFGTAWLVNFYKFTQCDFAPSWKGEIVHGVGVVVIPAAVVTMWFDNK
jgi:hypothetical protein